MNDNNNNGWTITDWFFFIIIQVVIAIFMLCSNIIPHEPYEGLIALMVWFYGAVIFWCVF